MSVKGALCSSNILVVRALTPDDSLTSDRTTDPEFPSEPADVSAGSDTLQTLVFSATLSKDLQQNLKKRKQRHSKGKGAQKASSALGTEQSISPEPQLRPLPSR